MVLLFAAAADEDEDDEEDSEDEDGMSGESVMEVVVESRELVSELPE